MKISIRERFLPYSHLPGTFCLLPCSHWQIQCFPTLLKFTNLVTFRTYDYYLPWKGPIKDFTIQVDLEKSGVSVFGHTIEGFKRLFIKAHNKSIDLFFEKERKKESLIQEEFLGILPKERLSLGMGKALDWELVKRRKDLREIFPLWVRLGQMLPAEGLQDHSEGVAAFLNLCEKEKIISHYEKIFLAGFQGILTPRLIDTDYQGIFPDSQQYQQSPLVLLSKGARLIRCLFFKELDGNHWSILSWIPPEFHCGRFIAIQTSYSDEIDLEWAKKSLKRVIIRPGFSRVVHLHLQNHLKFFRIRRFLGDKGHRQSVNQGLSLEQGSSIFLDRFEK